MQKFSIEYKEFKIRKVDLSMIEEKDTILKENETCPAVGYQAVNVNVPVSVRPFAHAGSTATKCCGAPIVKSGKSVGQGTKNGICNFTIGQNIVVAIPVAFGAEATVGDTFVDCLGASSEEIECDNLPTTSEPTQPEPDEPSVPDEIGTTV